MLTLFLEGEEIRRKSLCVVGATGLGKTQWARSLGEHLFFMGFAATGDEIDRMEDVEYAIFDDISGGFEKGFHHMKPWFGCNAEIRVKALYREPVLRKWGKPCIWLCNHDPASRWYHISTDESSSFSVADKEEASSNLDWWRGNVITVELNDGPLFNQQQAVDRKKELQDLAREKRRLSLESLGADKRVCREEEGEGSQSWPESLPSDSGSL